MPPKYPKLHRTNIRKLQVGEKIAEHGIVVERRPSGELRFSINVMVDGQRIHRIVGREGEGAGIKQCEELIERYRTEARENRLHLPKGRKLARTLAAASEEYLTNLEESGGRNMTPKRRHFRKYLCPALGHRRLDQLTAFD